MNDKTDKAIDTYFGSKIKVAKEFNWEDEWTDMPEFDMVDQSPKRKIVVSFRNDEDVQKFAELIGQNITPKQKSLWYPFMPKRKYADKRYVDES